MIATEGDVTDYAIVRQDLNAFAEEYGMQELAVDRLFQGAQLCTELQQDGFEVVTFGQGFVSMTAPTVRFDELVRAGKLHHGADPVLRWMASNVSVELDAAGNIKPSRKKSTEKIDGIVATIMALGRAMVDVPNESAYKTRGFRRL
jgi:phage terminase large subunit-like protein